MKMKATIKWVCAADRVPDSEMELLLFREDAGVFPGYYGTLAGALPTDQQDRLTDAGLPEEDLWETSFFFCSLDGQGRLQGGDLPTFWAEMPNGPLPVTE